VGDKFKRVLYKIIKITVGCLVLLIVFAPFSIVGLMLLENYILDKKYGIETQDVAYYEKINSIADRRAPEIDYTFFPSPKDINENEFFFSFHPVLDDGLTQVFLKIKYSEEDYVEEIERLSDYNHDEHLIIKDENNFNYVAYVKRFKYFSDFEYALDIKDENAFVYVMLSRLPEEKVAFDEIYLPKGYDSIINNNAFKGYSIYD
jgi:hypothetical protein